MFKNRVLSSVALILIIGMFASVDVLPSLLVVPTAHGAGGASALLGLFNEQRKQNVVFDNTLAVNSHFLMDVNVTATGVLKGTTVGLNYTHTVLNVASVTFQNSILVDTHIKYVNTTNTQTHWNPGNIVVDDVNNNGIYDSGEPVLSGSIPAGGTKLKTDTKIVFVDAKGTGIFVLGESVFYDALGFGVFKPTYTLFSGPQPGIWDGVGVITPYQTINNAIGFINFAIVDLDNSNPTVPAIGVILRINFTVTGTGSSKIQLNTAQSSLANPGPVPYQAIDGYFNNGSPEFSYSATDDQPAVTVVRLVSGTNLTLPVAHVNLSYLAGASAHTIVVTVLGVPSNTVTVLNSTVQNSISCSVDATHTPCHFTLSLRANGGSASAPGTSPSGTYPLAIIGNTSTAAGFLIRQAWTTLIIKPPHPPTFIITPTVTSFTQQAGNYTLIPLTVTLTCTAPTQCANDTVSLGSDANIKGGGTTFTFSPTSSGSFPMSSTANFSTPADLALKIYTFNLTATTLGTYSEVTVTKFVTLTMNVLRTHDLAVQAEAASKLIGYVGISLSLNPIKVNGTIANHGTVSETFSANVTARVALSVDPLIKGVRYHNTFFTAGDPLVYDTNGNGIADAGDVLISPGSTYISDPHILFNDTNNNGHWDPGEAVVYDGDGNGVYDSTDVLIAPGNNFNPPAIGAALKSDPLLKFVDFNANGHWDKGETVVYDASNTNLYVMGDYVISPFVGTNLSTDANVLLKFVDSNYNGHWAPGQTVAYDTNNNGVYDSGEPVIAGPAPSNGFLAASQTGIVLAAGASTQITFNVDPSALPKGTYVLYVYAQRVNGEFLVTNNFVGLLPFTQRIKGDATGDCKVNIDDIVRVASIFGKTSASPGFDPAADLNNDNVINISDLVLVAGSFGQHC